MDIPLSLRAVRNIHYGKSVDKIRSSPAGKFSVIHWTCARNMHDVFKQARYAVPASMEGSRTSDFLCLDPDLRKNLRVLSWTRWWTFVCVKCSDCLPAPTMTPCAQDAHAEVPVLTSLEHTKSFSVLARLRRWQLCSLHNRGRSVLLGLPTWLEHALTCVRTPGAQDVQAESPVPASPAGQDFV